MIHWCLQDRMQHPVYILKYTSILDELEKSYMGIVWTVQRGDNSNVALDYNIDLWVELRAI